MIFLRVERSSKGKKEENFEELRTGDNKMRRDEV